MRKWNTGCVDKAGNEEMRWEDKVRNRRTLERIGDERQMLSSTDIELVGAQDEARLSGKGNVTEVRLSLIHI